MDKHDVFLSIRSIIKDIVYEIDETTITEAISLRDLGISSTVRVDILMEAVQALGADVKLRAFGEAHNIGDIVSILHRGIRAQ